MAEKVDPVSTAALWNLAACQRERDAYHTASYVFAAIALGFLLALVYLGARPRTPTCPVNRGVMQMSPMEIRASGSEVYEL